MEEEVVLDKPLGKQPILESVLTSYNTQVIRHDHLYNHSLNIEMEMLVVVFFMNEDHKG